MLARRIRPGNSLFGPRESDVVTHKATSALSLAVPAKSLPRYSLALTSAILDRRIPPLDQFCSRTCGLSGMPYDPHLLGWRLRLCACFSSSSFRRVPVSRAVATQKRPSRRRRAETGSNVTVSKRGESGSWLASITESVLEAVTQTNGRFSL
jgi:hypothetical protein